MATTLLHNKCFKGGHKKVGCVHYVPHCSQLILCHLKRRYVLNGVSHLNLSFKSKLLTSAGIIFSLAAIWHLLCIIGGPAWFTFARAPSAIVISAQQGTLLAPIGTIIVALLMFTCTLYAFSGSGLIRKIPLLKTALITISILCLLRVMVVFPSLLYSSFTDTWQLIATSVWLFLGICFLVGSADQFGVKIAHNKPIKSDC